jgi:hypothetical protein
MDSRSAGYARTATVAGGYRLMSPEQVSLIWCAYRAKTVSLLDLRTYFALHEIAERRHAASIQRDNRSEVGGKTTASAILPELQKLVQCSRIAQVRASLKRLQAIGLLGQHDVGIRLTLSGDDVHPELRDAATRMFASLACRRHIPLPRRVLREIAICRSPAVVATLLAVSGRCVFLHRRRISTDGSVSVRFISETFGLHPRTVKVARMQLVHRGYLLRLRADHWHVQRYGARLRLNLPAAADCTGSSPRRRLIRTEPPPPRHKRELLTDSKNQKLAMVAKAANRISAKPSPGKLRAIEVGELRDRDRLNIRFTEAVGMKLVRDTPPDRLRFFAAAAHALRVATKNPCGLFAAIVRRGLWAYISQADEDQGQRLLRSRVSADRRSADSASMRRLCHLVEGLAASVAWPSSQQATMLRSVADTLSNRRAGSSAPAVRSSSRITSSESSTTAMFSSSVVRNATGSTGSSDESARRSMAGVCHALSTARNLCCSLRPADYLNQNHQERR